jgi:hypothetical protein
LLQNVILPNTEGNQKILSLATVIDYLDTHLHAISDNLVPDIVVATSELKSPRSPRKTILFL